ncbi:uncharacterized protein RJT20DRAFT_55459 [Scheffersomyces xylosifermentans]|uniref:uncharacterized protein n=1 Tax=Scheffersomyces xylosifermentans TaxID=1304137 RepID=UPI00315D4F14
MRVSLFAQIVVNLVFFIQLGLCNTETYLLKIPYYFNINEHPEPFSEELAVNRDIVRLNNTHSVLFDYPIETVDTRRNGFKVSNKIFIKDYDSTTSPKKILLIKVNNYNDSVFQSSDMLNVKLCWPATYPYSFSLSHRFLKTRDLTGVDGSKITGLDLYFEITYEFNAYTNNPERFLSKNAEVPFQLYITKLPLAWLPIPLELYGLVVYLVDITILLVTIIVPALYSSIFRNIESH